MPYGIAVATLLMLLGGMAYGIFQKGFVGIAMMIFAIGGAAVTLFTTSPAWALRLSEGESIVDRILAVLILILSGLVTRGGVWLGGKLTRRPAAVPAKRTDAVD